MSGEGGGRARSAGLTGETVPRSPRGRRFHAAAPPPDTSRWAIAALVAAVAVMAASWDTLLAVRGVLLSLHADGLLADALLVLLGLAAGLPIQPGLRSLRLAGLARRALASGDLITARVRAAASRDGAWTALGYAGAQALIVLLVRFVIVNDLAVGRTFFLIPLIASSFGLVLKAFWVNVYIFLVAEVLVLIWGLVVAVARMAPGSAGRPIRYIATFYVDVFRGLPAIINVYLVGFGLPLTGLPVLKDMSQASLAIVALTLTNGAYMAEIYRAGIESIHWSQTAAARSLGLSYLQTLRFVIIPQGVRHIIPPALNIFISLQKDTALVNVIGAIDAFNQSIIIASNHFNLSAVTTVAMLFVVITIPQARFVDRLIERDRRRRGA